jgi:hypothetical protein
LEHPSKQQTLELESALVICVGQNEEDVLDDTEEILLEEGVANSWICTCEIVDDLQAY